jgi:pantetheine-phosphate adenylyltransferase
MTNQAASAKQSGPGESGQAESGQRPPRIAIFPGSFDPITNGHVDIIRKALHLFDRVVVGVLVNQAKQPTFTPDERVAIIREVFSGNAAVEVDTFAGLLVDYAQRRGAAAIVRGLRAVSDFEYEMQMAHMNRHLAPDVETVFLMPDEAHTFLSSRLVKEVFSLGGAVGAFVPAAVERRLQETREAAGGGPRAVR